jgi:hypothetical protein
MAEEVAECHFNAAQEAGEADSRIDVTRVISADESK